MTAALIRGYRATFVVFLGCFLLLVQALRTPAWFIVRSPQDGHLRISYGLNRRCESGKPCEDLFPDSGSKEEEPLFYAIWQTAAFLMSAAVMVHAGGLFACVATWKGNRFTVERAWKLVGCLMAGSAVLQALASASTLLVVHHLRLYQWRISTSWVLATSSSVATFFGVAVLVIIGLMSPPPCHDDFYDTDLESAYSQEGDDFYWYNREQEHNFVNMREGYATFGSH
ncbi:hypothetical protein TRVA0_006S00232 [Trichomonascus vanleenenianus]|uniref:uncharacterized protein n=1 Tax=Trichomonascus vanleenenianus TaxID=2268995 RepID=UPI003ECA7938